MPRNRLPPGRYATALAAFVEQEFGDKVAVTSSLGEKGCFEVTVGGELIHSKSKLGHGKCNSDEELDAVLQKIQQKLD